MKFSRTCVHKRDHGTAVRMYARFKPHLKVGQIKASLKSIAYFKGIGNRKQISAFIRIVCPPTLLEIAFEIYESV